MQKNILLMSKEKPMHYHNKTSELSSLDFDKLTEELKSISDIDMTEFGFEELEASLDEVSEDNFNEDEAVPEVPYSKRGDISI